MYEKEIKWAKSQNIIPMDYDPLDHPGAGKIISEHVNWVWDGTHTKEEAKRDLDDIVNPDKEWKAT